MRGVEHGERGVRRGKWVLGGCDRPHCDVQVGVLERCDCEVVSVAVVVVGDV